MTELGATEPGRLVLLATTHRVAAGLLCSQAWDALRSADVVLTGDAQHELLPALAAAGIAVSVVPADPAHPGPENHARALLSAAPGGTALWVMSGDGDPGLVEGITSLLAGQASGTGADLPEVELLPGSWDVPGARLLDAVAVMDRLRSPGGCPWDARQTHTSLVEYLVEEAYETVEAIETNDDTGLREELGDVLLQVLFHARIAQERGEAPWSIDEVAAGLVDKLVSRHPHVFAAADPSDPTPTPTDPAPAATAEDVEVSWHALKMVQKGRESVTDGIPLSLPALVLASKLLGRAGRAGVALPAPTTSVPDTLPWSDEADLGLVLLSLVEQARERGVDAEAALRAAVRQHRAAIRAAEGLPPDAPAGR